MVLKWIDGGEIWGDAAGNYQGRGYQSGTTAIGAPRISPGLRSLATQGNALVTPVLGQTNSWVVGFGLKIDLATQVFQWRFLDAGLEQLRVISLDNGDGTYELRVLRGATVLGTTAEAFAENIWHFFEIKATVRTGTDGSVQIRHNETNVLTLASQNTADQGTDGCDAHSFGHAGAGPAVLMDDIYILDSTGTVNTDYLGDVVAVGILPDGEGNQNDFTPSSGIDNAALVDDVSTTASEADFVSSDTNAHQDFYTYGDLPATGLGSIFGIRIVTDAAMLTVGNRTLKPKFRAASSSEGDGDDFVVDGTVVVSHPVILDEDPVALAAWTKTAIDGGEFGVEVVS